MYFKEKLMKVRERLSKIFCLRIPLDPHGRFALIHSFVRVRG